jgi:hypothetical protein
MAKQYPALNMHPNKKGVIVGTCGQVCRIAAHTYRAPSGTMPDTAHTIFVAKLTPKARYRCSCRSFLFNGFCKHGPIVTKIERAVATTFPTQWEQECRPKPPVTPQPYVGGLTQETP